jgi:tetratricopeptide (TPR) repeat protein
MRIIYTLILLTTLQFNLLHAQTSTSKSLAVLIQQAKKSYRHKHYSDAIGLYQQALQIEPANAEVYGLMGYSYYRNGQLDQAVSALTNSIQIDPKLIMSHYNLALVDWALTKKGKSKEAAVFNEIGTVIRLDPKYEKYMRDDPQFREMFKSKIYKAWREKFRSQEALPTPYFYLTIESNLNIDHSPQLNSISETGDSYDLVLLMVLLNLTPDQKSKLVDLWEDLENDVINLHNGDYHVRHLYSAEYDELKNNGRSEQAAEEGAKKVADAYQNEMDDLDRDSKEKNISGLKKILGEDKYCLYIESLYWEQLYKRSNEKITAMERTDEWELFNSFKDRTLEKFGLNDPKVRKAALSVLYQEYKDFVDTSLKINKAYCDQSPETTSCDDDFLNYQLRKDGRKKELFDLLKVYANNNDIKAMFLPLLEEDKTVSGK